MPVLSDILPSHLAGLLWSAQGWGTRPPEVWPTGHRELDAALQAGGLPCHAVTEVLQAGGSAAEWRLLGPALARWVQEGGHVLLVAPPHEPFLPGLAQWGVPADRLAWVACPEVKQVWWVLEQALRANARTAVLGWCTQHQPEGVRRLQVLSASHPGLCLLFRPLAAATQASAAPVRLALRWSATGGEAQAQVKVLKHRGPPTSGWMTLHSTAMTRTVWPAPWSRPSPFPPQNLAPFTAEERPHALLDRLAHSS